MGLARAAIPLRVTFAGIAAEICCDDLALGGQLEHFFRHCQGAGEPVVRYTISRLQPRLWQIWRDQELIRQDLQELDVMEGLMHDLVAQLITRTHCQVVFHAAGVELNGRVALLIAESGAGKSSLAGWLIAQGWNYLGDEILSWDGAAGLVSGLARPLVLKRGATDLWQGWLKAAGTLEQAQPFGNGTLWLDPELIHPRAICRSATPGLLLFPHYQAGAEFEYQRLSQAEGVFRLLQHLVNGPNLPGEGFESAASLGIACPAFRLKYGEFSEMLAAWLKEKLNWS